MARESRYFRRSSSERLLMHRQLLGKEITTGVNCIGEKALLVPNINSQDEQDEFGFLWIGNEQLSDMSERENKIWVISELHVMMKSEFGPFFDIISDNEGLE